MTLGSKPSIAVIVHGHPDFSMGGAEVAAYNLYKGYGELDGVGKTSFLAGIVRPRQETSRLITPHRQDEYLWDAEMHDWHFFRSINRPVAQHRFTTWLETVRPDVIHAHHYAHMGIEMFRFIKQALPECRVFLTLHEYLAICKNNGQMVKPADKRLCSRESLEDCHQCYPDVSKEDFWLRKNFIQRHFDLVDGFVSPSDFLRRRYIAWGLPEEKIVTIENGQEEVEPVPHRPLQDDGLRNRFGFFGQINPFKGVDLLLEALKLANDMSDVPIYLDVNGANLDMQSKDFQQKIGDLRATLAETNALNWNGPYEPRDVGRRMRSVDWVVLPSIWWENSPMVIQEAYSHRRPVLAANIGGMAEKTAGGTPETQFEARSAHSLAENMVTLARNPNLWEENVKRIKKPMTVTECAKAHLEWFGSI